MAGYTEFLDWIDAQRVPMVERVQAWAEINSGSGNLAGLARMQSALAEAFAPLGGECEFVELDPAETVQGDGTLARQPLGQLLRIVRRPTARHRVLLVGHVDTVYPVEDAFQTCRRPDAHTLVGPGVADMKGGIAVMLTVLEALERSPWAGEVGWEVLLTPDEEVGSTGSAPHLIQAAARAQLGLVFEPTLADGTLVGARKGSGDFTAVVRGRTAHAGREPERGRNAVAALAALVTTLNNLNGKRPGLTVNVAKVEGGGPNNVVPDLALCRFNVRVGSQEDQAWFETRLGELADGLNLQEGFALALHGSFSRPPKPLTPEILGLFDLVAGCGEKLGIPIAHRPTGGCCDGNNLAAAGLPNVDTLGVRGGRLHREGEFVLLDSLTERAKLTALLLLKLASGKTLWPGRDQ